MSETTREPWATQAYEDYRKYRGALGPIMDKEVEAAFFDGLRRGLGHERFSVFGPPPWKVEDAFEVWKRSFANLNAPAQHEESQKKAFLAGAEYGAAAGSEGGPSEDCTDASLGVEARPLGPSLPADVIYDLDAEKMKLAERLKRYEECAAKIWRLFPADPLPSDDPAQFWLERLESIVRRGLLAPVRSDNTTARGDEFFDDYPPSTAKRYTTMYGAAAHTGASSIPSSRPAGDARECGAISLATSVMAADEKCFYLKGHALSHSWEHKDSCLAFRPEVDLSVRAFCGYKKGHPGIHSWELPANNPELRSKYHAIPSREEWKLERCRTLVFAIVGGLDTVPPSGDDIDPIGDYIDELRELWETM